MKCVNGKKNTKVSPVCDATNVTANANTRTLLRILITTAGHQTVPQVHKSFLKKGNTLRGTTSDQGTSVIAVRDYEQSCLAHEPTLCPGAI